MIVPEPSNLADDLITLFELTPDLVCIADKAGYFKKINPAVPKTLGYSYEELTSRKIQEFIHPDDREETGRKRAKLIDGETLLNFQNRYLTRNEEVVWLQWTAVYLPSREMVFAIAKNITTAKVIEREIEDQYRSLRESATMFKTSLEQDRKYLAAELHEELAQLAAAIRLDLEAIKSTGAIPENAVTRLDHAITVSDLLVGSIKRISFAISPAILDDLGLPAALEWYSREFSSATGIACVFESDHPVTSFGRDVQLDLFRICQEALENIKRFAQASRVKVEIQQLENAVLLTITDNGIGFNPNDHKKSGVMLSVRERAISLNARYSVNFQPGEGTSISIEVPL